MRNFVVYIVCVLFVLSIGGLSGYFTSSAITSWYQTVNKPSFNPPNYIFGPVWTILYALMGYSFARIILTDSSAKLKSVIVFSIQLSLNFLWSIIFFKLEAPGYALFEILLLWVFIVFTVIEFAKIDKVAGYLQIPYLLWVSFATILNASIYYLN